MVITLSKHRFFGMLASNFTPVEECLSFPTQKSRSAVALLPVVTIIFNHFPLVHFFSYAVVHKIEGIMSNVNYLKRQLIQIEKIVDLF